MTARWLKRKKSTLVALVESTWPQQHKEPVSPYAVVIDGMVLIHGLKTTNLGTMRQLASHVFKKISHIANEFQATRVDIVFGSYPEISIKEPEHERRSNGDFSFGNIRPEMKVPNQFRKFLCNNKSKITLIHFLVEQWFEETFIFTMYVVFDNDCRLKRGREEQVDSCPELEADHCEADTKLVLHANHPQVNMLQL